MKFFVGCLLIAVFAAGAVHAAISELDSSKQGLQPGAQQQGALEDTLRIRKAARSYGGGHAAAPAPAYMPSIPCPKNYLFSCQPQLQPVACAQPAYGGGSQGAQPAYGGGSQGAYSEQIGQWALPNEN